jgi:hypothetical protein
MIRNSVARDVLSMTCSGVRLFYAVESTLGHVPVNAEAAGSTLVVLAIPQTLSRTLFFRCKATETFALSPIPGLYR